MARFSGIPSLPQSGVEEWNLRTLGALKQNVELLTGSRGETDLASKALIRSQFTVNPPPSPSLTSVSQLSISPSITLTYSNVMPVASGTAGSIIVPVAATNSGGPDTNWTAFLSSLSSSGYASAQDVQRLASDVAQLRTTLNTLIAQLKA